MAMNLRYEDTFRSLQGRLWKVQLYKDGGAALEPASLSFPYDQPLVIEWPEVGKTDVIHSSRATLRLVSEQDRQFVDDMYQIAQGAVRLDVSLARESNGQTQWSLYWSGTLDTELYEEPYAYSDGYEVTLTFSDLAPLHRVNFDNGTTMTMEEIVEACLQSSGVNCSDIDWNVSTQPHLAEDSSGVTAPSDISLSDLSLQTAVFADSDTYTVLEEVLRPFGLHIIQREGRWIVFDWTWLYEQTPRTVSWAGVDSVLSMDKVYNRLSLTFDPGGEETVFEPSYESKHYNDWVTNRRDQSTPSFKYRVSSGTAAPKGFRAINGSVIEIDPLIDGSACAGIARRVPNAFGSGSDLELDMPLLNNTLSQLASNVLCELEPEFIFQRGFTGYLRLDMETLFDAGEGSPLYDDDSNEVDPQQKKYANIYGVPFRLELLDSNGEVTHVFRNIISCNTTCSEHGMYTNCANRPSRGSWVKPSVISANYNQGWYWPGVAWFGNRQDPGDVKRGWKKILKISGYNDYSSTLDKEADEALYIPMNYTDMPNGTGIRLTISAGYYLWLRAESGEESIDINDLEWKWALYKGIRLSLVDQYFRPLEAACKEYYTNLNSNAEEEMKTETRVGTRFNGMLPTAIGVPYYIDSDGTIWLVDYYCRGSGSDSIQGPCEELLLASALSQLATRHRRLSGEIDLVESYQPLTDDNMSGVCFAIMSDCQDLATDISDIVLCELSPDAYKPAS